MLELKLFLKALRLANFLKENKHNQKIITAPVYCVKILFQKVSNIRYIRVFLIKIKNKSW